MTVPLTGILLISRTIFEASATFLPLESTMDRDEPRRVDKRPHRIANEQNYVTPRGKSNDM